MKPPFSIWNSCWLFIALPLISFAQDVQLYGTIPSVLLKSSTQKVDYTFGISSEINAITRTVNGRQYPAEVLNLNLESAISYDTGPNFNIAGGFLYRFRNPFTGMSSEIRPWQQITFISRLEKYRVRNRLRLEERWVESRSEKNFGFDLRVRYRLSTDFPLQGERLDNKEWYLNFSTEAHITPTIKQPLFFWENRTYLGLGYRVSDKKRFEPALEFRTRKRDRLGNRQHILYVRLLFLADISKPNRGE